MRVPCGGGGAGGLGRGRALAGILAVVLAGFAQPLEGQRLSDYDYEDLTLRGIGVDGGYIFPSRVESTQQIGLRLDLGYLGPGVRVVPRVSYWSSTMKRGEVAELETRVAELVADQAPLAPPVDVDLGTIEWSSVVLGLDAQVVWRLPAGFLSYLGGGVSAHVQNGAGAAIDDTFVEDLLDSTAAGVNAHGGLEYLLTDHLRLYGEARFEALGDLRYGELKIGLSFMRLGPVPGEARSP